MSIIQGTALGGGVDIGDNIARSLRFNGPDSAHMSRSFTAGNRRTFAGWAWVKIVKVPGELPLIQGGSGGSGWAGLYFCTDASNMRLSLSVISAEITTSRVFRDTASWLHVYFEVDTTKATSTDRLKLWINGVQETSFNTSSYPSLNADLVFNNSGETFYLGRQANTGSVYANCYMAAVGFVDGSLPGVTASGRFSADTGEWVPKTPTGITYGTNGGYWTFSDNSGTTSGTLGKDSAGSNDLTPNNFSVSAGYGNDSLTDTPTNNFCVMLPTDTGTNVTVANGGLDVADAGGIYASTVRSSFDVSQSGKWYWECTPQGVSGTDDYIGIMRGGIRLTYGNDAIGGATPDPESVSYRPGTGAVLRNGSNLATYSTSAANDVVMFAFDPATLKLWIGKNGTWFNSGAPASGTGEVATLVASNSGWYPAFSQAAGPRVHSFNFGQRAFAYTPPTGFQSLCTANIVTPTILRANRYFDINLRTGTGASANITGKVFQPDLVWIKGRSGATDHAIYDSVRGVQKDIGSNLTTDETTQAQGVTAFNSDGFSIGTLAKINTNTATYVDWMWLGSATSGLDVVAYTGNGSNRTINHDLGVAPALVIIKARTTAGADQGWAVWHAGLANTEYLLLNSTAAKVTAATTVWNSTSPTSSVFSVGTSALVNTNSDTYVAYLFAEVAGFSKIGTYVGNGSSDGPFVYCGFRPRWVLYKNGSASGSWNIIDSARDTYNPTTKRVLADTTNDEATIGAVNVDFTATGFKIRDTNSGVNGSTNTLIFAAFAEMPFKYARAR